jgi:hypothetical protein
MAETVSGERCQVNLMYGLNSTFGAHKPYSTLPVDPQDGLGAAFFPWAEYHIAVSIDGKTLRMNAGKEKIASLIDTKNKQAMLTIATKFDQHLWDIQNATVTGTLAPAVDAVTGGSQINPIPLIVFADADLSGASFGGLNQNTYAWWRNQVIDFSTSSTWIALKAKLMELQMLCAAEGLGAPDLGICDKYTYLNYFLSVESQRRYTAGENAEVGAKGLRFLDMDFFYDPYICDCDNSSSPNGSGYNYDSASFATGSVYMLNTGQLTFKTLTGADWAWQGFRKPVDQDAQANLCIWNGQLAPTNRRCHGLLHGITYSAITS